MSYTKHNFRSGDLIKASDFNEIEDQIVQNKEDIDSKQNKLTAGANIIIEDDGTISAIGEGYSSNDMVLIKKITVENDIDRIEINTDSSNQPFKLKDIVVYYVLPSYDTSLYTHKYISIGVMEKIKNGTRIERSSANDVYSTSSTHNMMYWIHNNGFPIGINLEPATWEYGTSNIKSVFKPAFKVGICEYVDSVFLSKYTGSGYNCPPILAGTTIEVYGVRI